MKVAAVALATVLAAVGVHARPRYVYCKNADGWAPGEHFGKMGINKFSDGSDVCSITFEPAEFVPGENLKVTVQSTDGKWGMKLCRKGSSQNYHTTGRAGSMTKTFTAPSGVDSIDFKALCGRYGQGMFVSVATVQKATFNETDQGEDDQGEDDQGEDGQGEDDTSTDTKPLCSEKKSCFGSDVNGRCYYNKWTKTCSNDKAVKPANCSDIANQRLCNFGCEWDKATKTCGGSQPCAERKFCSGFDPSGKCYKNVYSGGCQSGKPTRPPCENITNFRYCNKDCFWDRKAQECFTKTKKPTGAPTEAPLCSEKKFCKGSDVNGRCYYNAYDKTCSNDKPSRPPCENITNFRYCNKDCFWDKKAQECSTKTKKPTGAPTEAPLCSEKKFCRGSDVNGRCYYNKWTQTCSNDKAAKPANCSDITNKRFCSFGCFYNKFTELCGSSKVAKPESCEVIVSEKICKSFSKDMGCHFNEGACETWGGDCASIYWSGNCKPVKTSGECSWQPEKGNCKLSNKFYAAKVDGVRTVCCHPETHPDEDDQGEDEQGDQGEDGQGDQGADGDVQGEDDQE